jgi:putative AbiEi antitoxin of type IV toxin-antitoxin system
MTEMPLPGLDHALLARLMAGQAGVVSRRQLVELGALPHEIARLVRRRELVVVHRGVYVNHTGALSRAEREWAAVLVHWPAALTGTSALPDPDRHGAIHVAVDLSRTPRPVTGVVAHRTTGLDSRVAWMTSPPRVRIEHAAIDVASTHHRDPVRMFRTLADVCQTRRTTAARIGEALESRVRVPGKALVLDLLDDLATGACSVLEREYLRIERRHGLPEGTRQKPAAIAGRSAYRDVDYEDFGVVVELDGRAFHDDAASRDLDARRDLEMLVDSDRPTVRLTYGGVFGTPCQTVAKIGALLTRRGWSEALRPCPTCPAAP